MSISQDTMAPEISYIGMATLSGTLVVKTGLHIGAGKDEIEIGGIDNPVVKTPQGDPYVPGSSIKGKMRFLLEWAFGCIDTKGFGAWQGAPGDDGLELRPENVIPRTFGTSADAETWRAGPTRLLIRDAMIDVTWKKDQTGEGRELTEAKTEVGIDRIAGKAADGRLHVAERVPPGARFKFEAAFRAYAVNGDAGESDMKCLAWAIQGLDLLEQDALGGSGSRGYGQIAFEGLTLKGPGRAEPVSLDNRRKGYPFDRQKPAQEVLSSVHQAFGRDG